MKQKLDLDQEFDQMAYVHHFSKFGEIMEDLRAEWRAMPEEHRDWARKLSSEIPDLIKALEKAEGSEHIDKARAKIAEKIEFREAELVGFFQAPFETMVAGPKKGLRTRREVYEKAFAKRDEKIADKAGTATAWTVGIAVGVAVATLGHQPDLTAFHVVGDVMPAVKSLHVFGAAIATATFGAKAGFQKLFDKAKKVSFELVGDWKRWAEDPKLENEEAPDVLPIDKKATWEAKAEKMNRLSRETLPADKLELQRVKGEKIIDGLEAVQAWRKSVEGMPSAVGLTIAAAIKQQKKIIAQKKASPEWATAEFKSMTDLLGDKKNQRSVGSVTSAEWRAWHGLRAISEGNPVLATVNASIRPVIAILNAETSAMNLVDRLNARRKGLSAPEPREAYSPKHWVKPPRAQ